MKHLDTWLFLILVVIFTIQFYWEYKDRKAAGKL